MGKETTGPSWRDCAELSQEITRVYGKQIQCRVVPPVLMAGRPTVSWLVQVEAYTFAKGEQVFDRRESASWGYNAGFATAPAAFYAALLRLWMRYDGARVDAEQAAMF